MPALIISSISPQAGKTSLLAAVTAKLSELNQTPIVASPPLQTLFQHDRNVRFADPDALADPSDPDLILIEGNSGDADADLQLAERLDAHVVLVSRFGEDTTQHSAALGDRLAGVVFNKAPRYRHTHLHRDIEELQRRNIPSLGWIPEDRTLAAHTIESIVQNLDGETIVEGADASRLIENYLIGGLVLDWGPFYFTSQEKTCVIVRGGRPDVQISALQSETTRAIIATGGDKPIEYVFYEARAKDIPLISVQHDTDETMRRIDAMKPAPFQHPEKLHRIVRLASHQDVLDPICRLMAQPATR